MANEITPDRLRLELTGRTILAVEQLEDGSAVLSLSPAAQYLKGTRGEEVGRLYVTDPTLYLETNPTTTD